jgi:hypothetical protein
VREPGLQVVEGLPRAVPEREVGDHRCATIGSGLIATPTAEGRKPPIAWPMAEDDNVVRDGWKRHPRR